MRNNAKGFTLIELLVVIGLIGVLVGGIGFAILGGGGGGLANSERIVQGFLLSARTDAAIATGTANNQSASRADGASALLLVNADRDDTDGYLREMHVVYWGTDVSGIEGWLTQRSAITLPNGIYFYPNDIEDPSDSSISFTSGNLGITLDTPSAEAQSGAGAGGDPWFFIPYDNRGRLLEIDEFQVVIAEGTYNPDPSASTPIEFDDTPPRGGYLILNTGAIARFPSESAIN
ncbi:MAG: prepilin-type N-terminal cleavage/methylation domain-containing protein [Verrucomicrobiota bacterium]